MKLSLQKTYPTFILTASLFIFLTSLLGIYLNYSPVLIGDEWHVYFSFYLDSLTNWQKALWEQHNEHREILDKLFHWVDMRWLGGLTIFGLIGNIIFAIGTCLSLAIIALVNSKKTRAEMISIIGFAIIVCFTWVQTECLLRPILWDSVFLFAILAFWLFQSSQQTAGLKSQIFFISSIVFGILSVCSRGNGLLVFPVLIFFAFYFHVSLSRKLTLLLFTLVISALYFQGYTTPDYQAHFTDGLKHPIEVAKYTFVFLGSPFSDAVSLRCYILGAMFALAGPACLAIFHRSSSKSHYVFIALIVFIFGSILLAAGARFNWGPEQALSSRYKFVALLYWFCILVFLYENTAKTSLKKAICTLAMLFTVFLLMLQNRAWHPDRDFLFNRNLVGVALKSDVYDDKFIHFVYPPKTEILIPAIHQAKALNLSIFKEDKNTNLSNAIISNAKPCSGEIEKVTATSNPNVYAIKGWIWDKNILSDSLTITDAKGHIIGEIIRGERRRDIAKSLHIHNQYIGWAGFIKGKQSTIYVYSQLANKAYCKIKNNKPLG
ncbi:MAG: hypothetical protein ACYCQI_04600 [Gammaproteobacteria bacterium]